MKHSHIGKMHAEGNNTRVWLTNGEQILLYLNENDVRQEITDTLAGHA